MVTECLSIRSFGKHILDYYDTKEILLVFQKEKKSVRFSGKLIPNFPVSSLMFCGYHGVTDRHDQSVDWTADLYREICGGRSKMNLVIGT